MIYRAVIWIQLANENDLENLAGVDTVAGVGPIDARWSHGRLHRKDAGKRRRSKLPNSSNPANGSRRTCFAIRQFIAGSRQSGHRWLGRDDGDKDCIERTFICRSR